MPVLSLYNFPTSCSFDELVLKVAVYKHLLAIQLAEYIFVAEAAAESTGALVYNEKCRLRGSFECALMLLIAKAVLLCKGSTLQLHELEGNSQPWLPELHKCSMAFNPQIRIPESKPTA